MLKENSYMEYYKRIYIYQYAWGVKERTNSQKMCKL
jgi:hypothetical protein